MTQYDFQTLSPREFEKLSRALLEKHLGIPFEIFKEGKDRGADLIYRKLQAKNDVVVQCKRYASKPFSTLKSAMIKEVEKIKKLNPKRYILITSVELSDANKDDLIEILSPYCKVSSDIYGASQINALLEKYPEIEKSHYKLWLTSTPVLEKILHANIENFSNFGMEHIKKHFSTFVFNASVDRAIDILREHHYCIIAGKPGIGKTTLAHVLISQFVSEGYELVSVTKDIEEAWKKYNPEIKRVFYYDDFLGQTSFQPMLEKNEDERLLQFIALINSSKNSIFILTTREYILNQAALGHEKIGRKVNGLTKCILELEDYTKVNRAEILYNHIYFSNLSLSKQQILLDPHVYKRILDHKNYYPRLIEDITQRDILNEFEDKDFAKAVGDYFDNPAAIWLLAFQAMSTKAQTLLLVLTTLAYRTPYSSLKVAFNNTYSYFALNMGWKQGFSDFEDALRELDGSPVKVTKVIFRVFNNIPKPAEPFIVEFENPSIRDFLENYLLGKDLVVQTLFKTATFFEQGNYLLTLKVGDEEKDLMGLLIALKQELIIKMYELSKCENYRISVTSSRDPLASYYVSNLYSPAEKLLRILAIFSHKSYRAFSTPLLQHYLKEFLITISEHSNDLSGLVLLADALTDKDDYPELNAASFLPEIINSILANVKEMDFDTICDALPYLDSNNEIVHDAIYDTATNEVEGAISAHGIEASTLNDLREKISELTNFGVPLNDLDSQLEREIDKLVYSEREDEYEDDYQGGFSNYKSMGSDGPSSYYNDFFNGPDKEIKDMFEGLGEIISNEERK